MVGIKRKLFCEVLAGYLAEFAKKTGLEFTIPSWLMLDTQTRFDESHNRFENMFEKTFLVSPYVLMVMRSEENENLDASMLQGIISENPMLGVPLSALAGDVLSKRLIAIAEMSKTAKLLDFWVIFKNSEYLQIPEADWAHSIPDKQLGKCDVYGISLKINPQNKTLEVSCLEGDRPFCSYSSADYHRALLLGGDPEMME